MHYAAGCSGTAPLEYLVSVGANLEDVDKQGCTPLIIACMVNSCPDYCLTKSRFIFMANNDWFTILGEPAEKYRVYSSKPECKRIEYLKWYWRYENRRRNIQKCE